VDYSDSENSVIVFMRKGEESKDALVVVCNFTPEVRTQYRIGVPVRGTWKEVFNSDNLKYGGSGQMNVSLLHTPPVKYHGKDYSLAVMLPPLGISIFKLHEEQTEFALE
jgi:1,4-alpha-glucan branching enzyme